MTAMRAIDTTALPPHVISRVSAARPAGALSLKTFAAAAAVAALLTGGIFLATRPATALAFPDVAARVEAAKTIAGRIIEGDDGKPLRFEARGTVARCDGAGFTMLMNRQTGELLNIDHTSRTAQRSVLRVQPFDVVQYFRDIAASTNTPLGKRKIDGIEVEGFSGRIREPDTSAFNTVRVWVNPATKLPVLLEVMSDEKSDVVSMRFDSFVFDAPIDDGRLAFRVPEGYRSFDGGGLRADQLKRPPTTQEAAALVIRPLVGVGPVKFGMSKDQVVAALGQPEQVVNDLMLSYDSRGLGMVCHPRAGVVMISLKSQARYVISNLHDFPGKTEAGVGIGSAREDVVAAYGKPDGAPGDVMKYSALGMTVILVDEKVGEIALSAPKTDK